MSIQQFIGNLIQELKKPRVKEGWYVVDVIQPDELLDGPYGDKEAARSAARKMKAEFPDEDIKWGMMFVSKEDVGDFSPPDWRKFKAWRVQVDKALKKAHGVTSDGIYDWHYRDDFDDGKSPEESAESAWEYFQERRSHLNN